MPTEQKTETVNDLSQRMAAAKSIVLADFTGLDVASVTLLRRSLRSASVDYRVVKNRLAKRAASDAGLSSLEEFFSGPTAMAFGLDDPLEPARVLQKFVDTGGKISIKSGFMDGQVLSPEQVRELASLPSREELIVKVIGAVQSPMYGLVGVFSALLRNLVGVVSAIEEAKKKESEGAAGAGE
jgi:large subunit ribosomal protein L10